MTIRAEIVGQKAAHVAGIPECVNGIKRQSGRVATIVRNLLRFARKQEPQRAPRDLREVVEHALELIETARTKAPVEIVSHRDGEPRMATIDEEQIEQVLTNLILNSIQAMPEGGTVTVGLETGCAKPPGDIEELASEYVCLYVEDEGAGIPEDVLPHLFDPFFTTKGVEEGTGLGLSISYGIVREHGGWIDVKTAPGQGSRFSVHLPAANGASPRSNMQRTDNMAAVDAETRTHVSIAEDDAELRLPSRDPRCAPQWLVSAANSRRLPRCSCATNAAPRPRHSDAMSAP